MEIYIKYKKYVNIEYRVLYKMKYIFQMIYCKSYIDIKYMSISFFMLNQKNYVQYSTQI